MILHKVLFTSTVFVTLGYTSLFTMTDRNGNILKSKNIVHTENGFLNQKSTEYSLQAMYDELHQSENIARMAAVARRKFEQIERKTAKAQKAGKSYHITEDDKQKLL